MTGVVEYRTYKSLMKTPKRLEPLVVDGLVDEVLRQLMSGKEATVYVVRCGEEVRCAKVYKDANHRSFKKNAAYQEGRKVKNSRQARQSTVFCKALRSDASRKKRPPQR